MERNVSNIEFSFLVGLMANRRDNDALLVPMDMEDLTDEYVKFKEDSDYDDVKAMDKFKSRLWPEDTIPSKESLADRNARILSEKRMRESIARGEVHGSRTVPPWGS